MVLSNGSYLVKSRANPLATPHRRVAQLEERCVRGAEVVGSRPISPTSFMEEVLWKKWKNFYGRSCIILTSGCSSVWYRALRLGRKGRSFESNHPDQFFIIIISPLRLSARTSGFHPEKTSSTLVGETFSIISLVFPINSCIISFNNRETSNENYRKNFMGNFGSYRD